jgi:hypothetical protein
MYTGRKRGRKPLAPNEKKVNAGFKLSKEDKILTRKALGTNPRSSEAKAYWNHLRSYHRNCMNEKIEAKKAQSVAFDLAEFEQQHEQYQQEEELEQIFGSYNYEQRL